jgi:hypothetical protein
MARAVAINVGANTNEPGFRGPIYPDGSFAFVPIPESKPAADPPTYADLDLDFEMPDAVADVPVHLDPEFAEYPGCSAYTYGDPYGVKARPLLALEQGDYVLFYATLDRQDFPGAGGRATRGHQPDWITPGWGAYLVGQFRLAREPVDGDSFPDLEPPVRDRFSNNAHVRREAFDAAVLLLGDPEESGLYDRALPLSSRERGVDANRIVTDLSSDSGKGPWWRRPMRFDADATAELFAIRESAEYGSL